MLGPAGSAFRELIEKGQAIDLQQYSRLGEHQVWALIDGWRDHKDKTLADLSARLMGRQLPKTMALPMESYEHYKKFDDLLSKAKDIAVAKVDYIDKDNVDFYVCSDDPHRTSYKTYDWKPDSANDSIWIMEDGAKAEPLEDHGRSKIVQGLKETKYFPRLTLPKEVRELLRN